MNDCLFCKIIAGQIPGRFVHEDHEIVAIRDINPQAPLHVLIIPRRHIATLNDLDPHDDALVGAMQRVAAAIAKEYGYAPPARRSSIFTCTCSQAVRSPGPPANPLPGMIARLTSPPQR